jgi:hypothetical protein
MVVIETPEVFYTNVLNTSLTSEQQRLWGLVEAQQRREDQIQLQAVCTELYENYFRETSGVPAQTIDFEEFGILPELANQIVKDSCRWLVTT